ncbi:hypothetical protein ILUMI_05868 [Ignelater luminosus]|uniref:Uncharacterized protein n=1 Tax=Ignelater luminosus TaxID=2038154 RepID=A0A8K0DBT3_IGNLU|nr:hypothetical protein ILUMI_05868 [Ignelater luminosus]
MASQKQIHASTLESEEVRMRYGLNSLPIPSEKMKILTEEELEMVLKTSDNDGTPNRASTDTNGITNDVENKEVGEVEEIEEIEGGSEMLRVSKSFHEHIPFNVSLREGYS